jgi:hypothetical protein
VSEPLLFLHAKDGPVPEPPVSNRDFIDGFIEWGAWLRVVKASTHVDVLGASAASDLQRLAAVTGLYEQAGFQAEDTVTNLIAWSLWKLDPERPLADILEWILISMNEPSGVKCDEYRRDVQQHFLNGGKKRYRVNACSYLAGLHRDESGILDALGITWKPSPSVKACPTALRPTWELLPSLTDELLKTILGDAESAVSQTTNKLKHGPQLVFDAVETGASRRGIPGRLPAMGMANIAARVLFDGARLQETPDDRRCGNAVAPYLVSDGDNAEQWLGFYLVHVANMTRLLATFLRSSLWRGEQLSFVPSDKQVTQLIRRQAEIIGVSP